MPHDASSLIRPAQRPRAPMRPRTDAATVVIHWTVALLFVLSVITGFRIAADAQDAAWSRILSAIALQGEVVIWHAWSAWALVAATAGYVVFLLFARLVPRVSVDASRLRALSSRDRRTRWQSINVLIYWIAFAAIVAAIGSGTLLYFPVEWMPHAAAAAVHRVAAWSLVAYVFIHAGAQWWSGGVQGLLKILRPRMAYGAAAILAVVIAGAVGTGAFVADGAAVRRLVLAHTSAPPRLDGETSDAAWRQARPVSILTRNGAHLPGGEVTVTVRAAHDGEHAYFLFEWPDATRSQTHLPLRKVHDGWEIVERNFTRNDENDYYEDKLAVMLGRGSRLAGISTVHLGTQPIADRPGPAGRPGLHYTTDGSIVDVWHWKSVRTAALGQIDDNYFGPPLDAPNDPAARYTGGYSQDPKTGGGFIQNWTELSDGKVRPLWLPRYRDLEKRLGDINLDPNISDDGEWFLPKELVVPYSSELDATFPPGTIMPSVIIDKPFEGDRGDVSAVAKWSNGWWRLEVARKLDTGSKFDVQISDGTYLWVAVFDHTQTRHSWHLHPLRLELR
jgi:cytochrome b subunit of formate dehydrogenase